MEKSQKEYEVKNVNDLLDILEANHVDRFDCEIIEYNDASLFRLPDEKLILIPAMGTDGILYYDEQCFKKMLREKYFPVEGDGSLLAVEAERIQNLDANIDYFISELSKCTNIKLSRNDDTVNLADLSKEIYQIKKAIGAKEAMRRLMIPLGIYLGEIVKQQIGSEWELEKYELLNPYWIPHIKDNERYSTDLWDSIEDFFSVKKNDLVFTVNQIKRPKGGTIKTKISPEDIEKFRGAIDNNGEN